MTPAEVTAWEKISELASRFRGYPTQAGYPLIDPATAPRWVLMLILAVNAIVACRYGRRA